MVDIKAGMSMVETRTMGPASGSGMAYRFALALALALFSGIPAEAQFGNPYPGGSQGGIGFPGGGVGFPGTNRGRRTNGPNETISGKIQRIATTQLSLSTDDRGTVTIALDRNTRYFDTRGNNARYGDFDTGDEVTVDTASDNQGLYHAVRVTMMRRAAANETTSSTGSSSSSNDDSDKPRLKRAGSAGSDSGTSSAASSGSSNDDPDKPRLRRASSADPNPTAPGAQSPDSSATTIAPRRSSTAVAPKQVANEADDPGPPVLRRDAAARVDRTPVAGSAEAEAITRPSLKASADSNGVTRLPSAPVVGPSSGPARDGGGYSAPPQRPGDPVINSARDAAFEFTDTLPNYIVKQFTTRYQTDTAHGNRTSWQALDVVTADVVCEGGKESYKNVLINGKAPKDAIEKTGSWSTGEFATVLQGILAPQTDADFHNKRSTTIVNRPAWRYDYAVEQPRSMWHVYASSESYVPGYTGSIWIDKETFRVLRIEMSAVDMPRAFALDAVESAVDYDYVLIGDKKALLPTHSEALSCIRGTSECTRNVIDFRNYKKFGADTSITFDTDK
jgi:hypothetical protein